MKHLVLLLTVLALLGTGCLLTQSAPARSAAVVEEPFPIPVIELHGPASELGQQYGRQLQEPIHELFNLYLKPYFKNDLQRLIALTAAQGFSRHLLPEHMEEVKALAQQVQLDVREVLLAQCFLDLTPLVACSTLTLPAEAAPDGIARFGRNLDFPSKNIADKHTVVLIYKPQGRYAFAAVSWPGLLGVLSGMNEHGLTLANMEVDRSGAMARGMPYTMLYRTVLEQCRTVEEAVTLLEKTPRQTANNLMLMDADGHRAVVEITPQGITVRRGQEAAALISTNHHRGQDADAHGRCWRYDELNQSARENVGQIGRQDIEAMLGRVAQGEATLQSMVFEPSERVIYLAAGANAASLPFHRLDLKRYFDANGN